MNGKHRKLALDKVVMTVVFRDVSDGLNMSRGMVDGLSFTELLYADDTVLITKNVNAMNRLLKKVEQCALYHGLNFNKQKCVSFNFHTNERTKYANGAKVRCADSTTYLGAELNKFGTNRKDINSKISQCIVISKKLQYFWNNPSCPTKFKLQVFDAVIRSKLVYSLESLELSSGTLGNLNAFQLKGLRRILKIKTTYVERANTNKKVFEQANAIVNPNNTTGKHIKPFSEYIQTQQHKFLAHIVRAQPNDPLRECTLQKNTPYPYEISNRRVGRPRNSWTSRTYERLVHKNSHFYKGIFFLSGLMLYNLPYTHVVMREHTPRFHYQQTREPDPEEANRTIEMQTTHEGFFSQRTLGAGGNDVCMT